MLPLSLPNGVLSLINPCRLLVPGNTAAPMVPASAPIFRGLRTYPVYFGTGSSANGESLELEQQFERRHDFST